jgi:hypothetical protein
MNFTVYNVYPEQSATLEPLGARREWMDDTFDKHAYHCFPVSLSNTLGWGISFPSEISFIWDGISDSTDTHVKVLSGKQFVSTSRANATLSFNTNLVIKTEQNVSMLAMPTPNWPIDGVWPFTTLISTSFFKGTFPVAWRITKANEIITIPANTPVAAIIPISLSNLNNSVATIKGRNDLPEDFFPKEDYGKIVSDINKSGKWTNFYRDAVDHKKNKIGSHEVKSLKLKTDNTYFEGPEGCGIQK